MPISCCLELASARNRHNRYQQLIGARAGSQVQVRLLGRGLELAELIVIGSHCVGLDYLLTIAATKGVGLEF